MKRRLYALPLAVAFLTPSLIIFLLEITLGGIPPWTSVCGIASRQFAPGHNLFLLALLGSIPFVALTVAVVILDRYAPPWVSVPVLAGGLIGILALMVPAHISVWRPLYDHSMDISSTAVIAFLFIPFYCFVPMGIGMLLGGAVSGAGLLLKRLRRRG